VIRGFTVDIEPHSPVGDDEIDHSAIPQEIRRFSYRQDAIADLMEDARCIAFRIGDKHDVARLLPFVKTSHH